MSVMAKGLYDEAIVDVVGPHALMSEPCVVKDLHLSTITTKQLDFSSSFSLVSTVERRTKVSAFILYFDTFFRFSGEPVPEGTEVKVVKEGEAHLAEVWHVGGRPASQRRRSSLGPSKERENIVSFSTGPKSAATHWKQTLFCMCTQNTHVLSG